MEAAAPISVKDVADLLFAARERIDYYWNFYVVVVIAAVGWLVTLKRALTIPMRILVSVVFVLAALSNILGLWSAYTLAEALRTDLLHMTASAPLGATRAILEQHSFLSQRMAALWLHLAIGIPFLLIVWFAPFSNEPSSRPNR